MVVSTQGLIVKSVKYSETSLILTLFTKALGLQSYMMRGVRASKSKGRGNVLQPMQLLHVEVTNRENKNLQTIKEFRPALVYEQIPFHINRTAMGMFMLEVINASIQETEPNEALFEYLESAYHFLDQVEEISPLYHLKFMLGLTGHLGFLPMNNYSTATPYFALDEGQFVEAERRDFILSEVNSALFHKLLITPMSALAELNTTKIQRKSLLSALEAYFKLHVMNFREFRTPLIFGQVFE